MPLLIQPVPVMPSALDFFTRYGNRYNVIIPGLWRTTGAALHSIQYIDRPNIIGREPPRFKMRYYMVALLEPVL